MIEDKAFPIMCEHVNIERILCTVHAHAAERIQWFLLSKVLNRMSPGILLISRGFQWRMLSITIISIMHVYYYSNIIYIRVIRPTFQFALFGLL